MGKTRVWSDEECDWLKENISYDPDTGILTWLNSVSSRGRKGNEVGTLNLRGYRSFARNLVVSPMVTFLIGLGSLYTMATYLSS